MDKVTAYEDVGYVVVYTFSEFQLLVTKSCRWQDQV